MEQVRDWPNVKIDERPNWLLKPKRDRNFAIKLSVINDAFMLTHESPSNQHPVNFDRTRELCEMVGFETGGSDFL